MIARPAPLRSSLLAALLSPALAVALLNALPAQQKDDAPPVPAAAAQVERAQALLRAHGERCKGVKVVVADYVQRRTTALVKEPLVSKGRFLFVRDPAAVLFFATEPRESTVRLTATTYEVYRPQKHQLERFYLDGPDLAMSLFAVVGGDTERLLRDFVVTSCAAGAADSGTTVARLVAKDAAVRARVQELVVTFAAADGALAGVGYRDHSGDLVEIELRALKLDPKDAPSASLDVPKDTAVVEHRAAPPKGK